MQAAVMIRAETWREISEAVDVINHHPDLLAYFLTDQAEVEALLEEVAGHCAAHGDFDPELYRSCPRCYAEDHPNAKPTYAEKAGLELRTSEEPSGGN